MNTPATMKKTAIFIIPHVKKVLSYDIAITRVSLKDSKTICLHYQKRQKFKFKQYDSV